MNDVIKIQDIPEKTILMGKVGEGTVGRGRPNIRQIISIKEAMTVSLQDLSIAYWKKTIFLGRQ